MPCCVAAVHVCTRLLIFCWFILGALYVLLLSLFFALRSLLIITTIFFGHVNWKDLISVYALVIVRLLVSSSRICKTMCSSLFGVRSCLFLCASCATELCVYACVCLYACLFSLACVAVVSNSSSYSSDRILDRQIIIISCEFNPTYRPRLNLVKQLLLACENG